MFGSVGSRAGRGLHLHGIDVKVSSPNTTTNVVANTSGLHVGNSTVNTHLIVPTSAQYSATNYFLHANGSWIQVSAGSSATQVYQAYTATASQTTFAVSGGYTVGMVDVFYNGDKLARSEFTATDGSNVVLGVGA